jgi:hypothetical protein
MGQKMTVKTNKGINLPNLAVLTTQEKVIFISSAIVDRILLDQESGGKLLSKIEVKNNVRPSNFD